VAYGEVVLFEVNPGAQYFAKMFEPVLRRANHRFPFALFAASREISARGDRASRVAREAAKSSFRALRTHVEASREAASFDVGCQN
jgi:hypothetical protein